MKALAVLYFLVAGIFAVYNFKRYFLTPELIFVGMQMVMFGGILTYTDSNNGSDCRLILIYFLALVFFILGTLLSGKLFGGNVKEMHSATKDENELGHSQKLVLLSIFFVSILICAYFFISVGANVFLLILKSAGQSNYTNSRLAFNSVRGVGYVYQFRVILLPVVCAFLMSCRENKTLRRIGFIGFPLMIVFILGTGQRGGFVMFIIMWTVALLYLYYFYRDKKIRMYLIIIVCIAGVLFGLLTIFNGRVSNNGTVIQAMLKRVFDDNQLCAVVAFRYIDKQPIQYGADWFHSIMDILPGKNEYVQVSYIVFSLMYGSTRGTAPPCIWGSTYYNWGFLGVIVFAFILGVLYHRLYYSFIKGNSSTLRIYIYSAMFVVLGNWIADTPLVLFNQGFVTLCILKFLLIPSRKIMLGDKVILGK